MGKTPTPRTHRVTNIDNFFCRHTSIFLFVW
jgi:hypothetical protein